MGTNLSALDQKISDALRKSPHFSGRQLRYETQDDRVILRGRVASYFQKQMAQETIRQVNGVNRIDNEVEVAPPRGPKFSEFAKPQAATIGAS